MLFYIIHIYCGYLITFCEVLQDLFRMKDILMHGNMSLSFRFKFEIILSMETVAATPVLPFGSRNIRLFSGNKRNIFKKYFKNSSLFDYLGLTNLGWLIVLKLNLHFTVSWFHSYLDNGYTSLINWLESLPLSFVWWKESSNVWKKSKLPPLNGNKFKLSILFLFTKM